MGVGDIWIDVLCIIQDSAEDWQRECTVMGEVYGNSFLNLCAFAGGDSRSGLFPERDKFSLHTGVLKVGPPKSVDSKILYCRKRDQ